MRVACIGNMNNNYFSVTRFLRDRGIDADLLLLKNELAHFHPSTDTFDLDYQRYTKNLRWGDPFRFTKTDAAEVASDLRDYDFIVGCDTSPAFANKVNRRLDMFIPYGTDLFFHPFFRLVNPRHQYDNYMFGKSQRAAIENARFIVMDLTNDEAEETLKRLNVHGQRLVLGFPMVYTPIYNPQSISQFYDRSHWYHEFKRIRDAHDLVIFHHSRHSWKNSEDRFSWKGNDKLWRGFAQFVAAHPDVKAAIVTCERGVDVNETKRLTRELGLEDRVFWFPQMARKDVMVGLSLADVGSGEFNWSWLSCGTVYETLAMAKPLMHYRDDSLYRHHYQELYPLMNVHTEEEIAEALADYLRRPDYYRSMGEQGRAWFQRYAIDEPLDEYVRIIESSK